VLIKRYTPKWELTEAEESLYRHAVRLLQDIKEIKQEISEIEEGVRGILSIGVSSSCVGFLLTKASENFVSEFMSRIK